MLGRVHLLHGLVEVRIEGFPGGFDRHDLVPAECRLNLLRHHANALDELVGTFGRLGDGQRPMQVVERGKRSLANGSA